MTDECHNIRLTIMKPRNRREQFRADHFPQWLLCLWPVRHTIQMELSSLDYTLKPTLDETTWELRAEGRIERQEGNGR